MSESRPGPDLGALRREYGDRGLDVSDLAPDPIVMFRRWFDDTVAAGLHEPNAMVVTTVSAEAQPSARMVLLKGVDEQGFVFYTNYESRKGHDLEANPAVSLLFPWHELQRQVRVEGTASRVSRAESEAYFASRPRGSQLGAWASPQSGEVSSRAELDELYAGAEERFAGENAVPLPPGWGGFRVRPETVEFWQGRKGRMHDRLVYHREDGTGWSTARLAP
jgi:pyridoxamine 5'-phosphate oxidase